jgi:Flp pilus assembly protein TadD
MDHQQQVLKRAFVAHNAGRHEEAEVFCRTLVQAGLDDAQLFFLLGMVLHKTGRGAQAVQWLERAAQLEPGDARIFSGLGCVWQKLGDPAKAARHFARAAELEPRQANHFYSLGNVTYQFGELESAAAAFQRAVELNPRDAESWNNLGKCLKELNRVDESIAAYDHALELQPGYLLARQGRSISLLTAGRLAEGFRDYELRWLTLQPRQFTVPRWAGQPIPGQTLFLHAEQGFGDGIQSARYARLARERCGRVILECRPELKTLFKHSGVADEVIAFGEAIPPCDFYTSVISLPGLLGITLENIPGRPPYLQAPPARELPPRIGKIRVGLAWAGSPTHNDDAARSLPLAMLAPVLTVPDVTFYSLQMPVPKRDEPEMEKFPNLVDLGGFTDYLTTASAVASMDMVISVDTSVAHLAGALGKPVWTLIQFAPDWRWFQQFGGQTPWYPTMRLFRQPRRGDWLSVIARVAAELSRQKRGKQL